MNLPPLNRRRFLGLALALLAIPAVAEERPPNIIVLLCDNLGYGDVGCYGSKKHRTPHIDRMAREGMRFTSFYSTSGVCTPSRASLMTGCYPRRVGLHVDPTGNPVMICVSQRGIHANETTIAEVLKQRGYTTKIIGKWHLGDQPPFLPTRHGFDSWFGIPYSDDMGTRPPVQNQPARPALPLMRNEKVVEIEPDRNLLTQRYTEEAIEFLKANREHPFFLYLPHAMPGSTRAPFASDRFRGKSANGPWGDSVEELDWSTGQILAALKELKLDENTLIIWTNDNGAPRRNPTQGLNHPLAGWGYNTSEGAHRVPCIMRWPGKIPAGSTSDELTSMMDLLPTFAGLAGTTPPPDRMIDGHDIYPLMTAKPNTHSPYDAFYYYYMEQLQAVRSGKWKLYLPLKEKWINFRRTARPFAVELYDLDSDLGEQQNLANSQPDIVQRLLKYADRARKDLGDHDRPGANQRPAGFVADPTPRLLSDSKLKKP
jgi:arylsulfatase A